MIVAGEFNTFEKTNCTKSVSSFFLVLGIRVSGFRLRNIVNDYIRLADSVARDKVTLAIVVARSGTFAGIASIVLR